MSLKIFQIGFNRCGTKTIHDYLCANGLQGVHWDKGRLAKRIFTNRQLGRDLISGYEFMPSLYRHGVARTDAVSGSV